MTCGRRYPERCFLGSSWWSLLHRDLQQGGIRFIEIPPGVAWLGPTEAIWHNRFGPIGRRTLEAAFAPPRRGGLAVDCAPQSSGGDPTISRETWHELVVRNIVDWLGGYPYEFASPAEIFNVCHGELGFQLENMATCTSIGCNEFLFMAPREGGKWAAGQSDAGD